MNIITTSQKAKINLQESAKTLADSLGITYVKRNGVALQDLQNQYKADYIISLTSQGPSLYLGEGKEHHFHLSMAQLRILRIQNGEKDHLLEAIGLNHLDSFLDCTLGLASDSIVVSYAYMTGQGLDGLVVQKPRCIGLEGYKPLAFITTWGLNHFVHTQDSVTQALRNIKACYCNYRDYLPQLSDDSMDVVYFDPMFEVPIQESPQFQSLRGYTIDQAFTPADLEEALRVAKYKVIIKERPSSSLFKRMSPDYLVGGKYSRIVYGVYQVKES